MGKNDKSMLEKLIIVDYQEGAGGEFFSLFLDNHFNTQYNLVFCMQNYNTHQLVQKYLNSTSIVYKNWDDNINFYLDQFVMTCTCNGISNICVPYHLYKWPKHMYMFDRIASNVRFVKIDSIGFEQRIQLDFIRKVYLRKITDLHEVNYLLNGLDINDKLLAINKLKEDDLLGIDFYLLRQGKTISSENRRQKIDKAREHRVILPSNDVIINYNDFFYNLDNIKSKYSQLCNSLEIPTNYELLDLLVKRNTENALALDSFMIEYNDIYKLL